MLYAPDEASAAFAVLGVLNDTGPASLKAAYRALAGKAHPDTGGSREAFHDLSEAYRVALDYAANLPCKACHGSGSTPVTHGWLSTTLQCEPCGGSGKFHRDW